MLKLFHFGNYSSGPSDQAGYPGGFPRSILNIGPRFWLTSMQRAKQLCPNVHGILLDDPFGKYPIEPNGPNNTLLMQRSKAMEAGFPLRNMCDLQQMRDAVQGLRNQGFEVRMKLGYAEASLGINQFSNEILPLAALQIPTYIDSSAISIFQHTWMSFIAKQWGMPWLGVEAIPEAGGPLDSADYPSLFVAQVFYNLPVRQNNPGLIIWRGSRQGTDGTARQVVQTARQFGFDIAMSLTAPDHDTQGIQDIIDIQQAIADTSVPSDPPGGSDGPADGGSDGSNNA